MGRAAGQGGLRASGQRHARHGTQGGRADLASRDRLVVLTRPQGCTPGHAPFKV